MSNINKYLSNVKLVLLLLNLVNLALIITNGALEVFYPEYFSVMPEELDAFRSANASIMPDSLNYYMLALSLLALVLLFKEKMLGVYLVLLITFSNFVFNLAFDQVSIANPIADFLDDLDSLTLYGAMTVIWLKHVLNLKFDLSLAQRK